MSLHDEAAAVADRVARAAARRFVRFTPGELLGVAFVGALAALERWRPDGGASPSTWPSADLVSDLLDRVNCPNQRDSLRTAAVAVLSQPFAADRRIASVRRVGWKIAAGESVSNASGLAIHLAKTMTAEEERQTLSGEAPKPEPVEPSAFERASAKAEADRLRNRAVLRGERQTA